MRLTAYFLYYSSWRISALRECAAKFCLSITDILNFMEAANDSILDDDREINRASRCLKAMSHPLRLKILCVLGNNSISVQSLVEQVGTSQSNISQHLAILRSKGILDFKKEANRVYYFIDDTRVIDLIQMMRGVFCGK